MKKGSKTDMIASGSRTSLSPARGCNVLSAQFESHKRKS
jgi:hypothetical protein